MKTFQQFIVEGDFDNRTRFNWGFHAGASGHKEGHSRNGQVGQMSKKHHDQVYVKGYHMGHDASARGEYDHSTHGTTTSDAAWKESGLKNGHSLKPHKLMGKDSKGRKIAPWMRQD